MLFTDECWSALGGSGSWQTEWCPKGELVSLLLRNQPVGEGIIFWTGINGNELVSSLESCWRCQNEPSCLQKYQHSDMTHVNNIDIQIQSYIYAWEYFSSSVAKLALLKMADLWSDQRVHHILTPSQIFEASSRDVFVGLVNNFHARILSLKPLPLKKYWTKRLLWALAVCRKMENISANNITFSTMVFDKARNSLIRLWFLWINLK